MSTQDILSSPLVDWSGPRGLPRFDLIDDAGFAAAFDAAMSLHEAEIAAIASASEEPTFANTIGAFELSGNALNRVSSLFWHRAGANTNDVIQSLEREISPKLSRHYSRIGANAALFARFDALWQTHDSLNLTAEEVRVLERHWKGFVRSGAKLPADQQQRLMAIKEQLSSLQTQFGQNLLADEKDWVLFLADGRDLAGLPAFLTEAMAVVASDLGKPGTYAVTLSRSIIEPFLTFSQRRDLRETAFKAWVVRGANPGPTDNRTIIGKILALRADEARMLGYATFADFKLESSMAKTPASATDLMTSVWTRAVARACAEEAEIAALIAEEGLNHDVMPWDWRYYAEKIRARTFDFSESELKPYLQLDRIIAASFDVAGRLFGISAIERTDIPLYHPDVRLFEIRDDQNKIIALFLGDYFARPSKRSGAWMSAFQRQHKLATPTGANGSLPIIYNVCNFAKPPAGRPALLSLDDARTVFHEFGHALHGMLSDVTYPSVAGTSVSRDFVELPSQLYEHWLTVPDILRTYAVHQETGEPMPSALLGKVLAARTFNSGHATVEFTASALVDMAFHTRPAGKDPMVLQTEILHELGMPAAITMRHAAPHFGHVFGGGYASEYYSYMWSEVLDADAFAAFTETGDAFDAETARKLKDHIYSVGGSIDPADAYLAFRGRMPSPDAMMAKKGLTDA